MPAHIYFVMEDALYGRIGVDKELLVMVYLDDIAIFSKIGE